MSFDLAITEALWVLDLLPRESLPNIAVDAIKCGVESDSMFMLAGCSSSEVTEASVFFEQSLIDLGLGKISKQDAVRLYAKHISVKILKNEIDPYLGAKMIWRAARKVPDTSFHDVDPFIYAASEYEDRPEDREFFRNAICDEAQRWNAI